MGCRCIERRDALVRAASAVARGRIGAVVREVAMVGRTLAVDVRSGALQQAARSQLARMRLGRR